MREYNINGTRIVSIDHGYGNIKTAHTCFKASILSHECLPTFTANLLEYKGRYYTIGTEHKPFIPDKIMDEDYYILTLMALAKELSFRGIPKATIHLAAGLPLNWVRTQREAFSSYLLKEKELSFSYNHKPYQITLAGLDLFPQGFAAIAEDIRGFKGVNLLADIGNGTMNTMYIIDRKPIADKCFTEKLGTHQCKISIDNEIAARFGMKIDESIIDCVLKNGTADIGSQYLDVMKNVATAYVESIFQKLAEYEYNSDLMRLYVVGGGSSLVKHFGHYDTERTTIIEDICATAKGYEYLAYNKLVREHRR